MNLKQIQSCMASFRFAPLQRCCVEVRAQTWTIIGDPTEGALLTLAGKARLTSLRCTAFLRPVWASFSSESANAERNLLASLAAICPFQKTPPTGYMVHQSWFCSLGIGIRVMRFCLTQKKQ